MLVLFYNASKWLILQKYVEPTWLSHSLFLCILCAHTAKQQIYCKVKMNDNHNEEQEQIISLIEEITNIPEGLPCFLCLTTYGKECLWHEIGEDIVAKCNNTQEHGEAGHSMVEKHKTVHFTCYCYYTFTVSGWS